MPDSSTEFKWTLGLLLGTICPALGGCILMRLNWLNDPTDAWELMAAAFTALYFIVFNIVIKTMGERTSLENSIDFLASALMLGIVGFWLSLIIRPSFLNYKFSMGDALRYRCICALSMILLISVLNTGFWRFWARREHQGSNAIDLRIRYHLSVFLLDLPSLGSLIIVYLACCYILTDLPLDKLSHLLSLTPAQTASSSEHIRVTIASAFFSGASAFHIMLGNAVFSFMHSGRILNVLKTHSFMIKVGVNP